MTLRPGDSMPTFQARSDDGRIVSPATLAGGWAVLFFFPRAASAACTLEALGFQRLLAEFGALGAQPVGISTDTEARQALLREKCGLSFPLLPDGNRQLGRTFGVMSGLSGLLGLAQRQTFLFAPDGRLAHHWPGVQPQRHPAEVLERLRGLVGSGAD